MNVTQASQPGAQVELLNLTKNYAGKDVVSGIDLRIHPGEFVTLLGPSGSGKTTTLNLIAGFTSITSGQIIIGEKDISSTPAHRRGLGVVFQHYALFPHLTVIENVMFPLRRRGEKRKPAAEKSTEVLRLVGLDGYESRRVSELSGGQQQRVALARALVYRPPLLLMDEPLGALDKRLRDNLQVEIKRIQTEVGSTCIFVTHDQEEALTMSDRIAVFHEGKVVQFDTPDVVYGQPATLFVARFLGDSVLVPGDCSDGLFRSSSGNMSMKAEVSGPGTMFVRPENVRVAAAEGDVPTYAISFQSRIESQIFLGSASKIEFRLPDGTRAFARLQASEARRWTQGETVWIWWDESDARILVE